MSVYQTLILFILSVSNNNSIINIHLHKNYFYFHNVILS